MFVLAVADIELQEDSIRFQVVIVSQYKEKGKGKQNNLWSNITAETRARHGPWRNSTNTIRFRWTTQKYYKTFFSTDECATFLHYHNIRQKQWTTTLIYTTTRHNMTGLFKRYFVCPLCYLCTCELKARFQAIKYFVLERRQPELSVHLPAGGSAEGSRICCSQTARIQWY